MTAADDGSNLRLEWRIALRVKWTRRPSKGGYGAPRGKEWRSLSAGFSGFLLYLGDVADADGNCRKFLPSQESICDFLRIERETVRLYYQAAEAAGIIRLSRSPKGQINGFQLTFPLGGKPHWDMARDVLHDDRRAAYLRHQRATAEDEVMSRNSTSVVSRNSTSGETEEAQVVSRNDGKWSYVTGEVMSRNSTTRSTRISTDMAGSVEPAADTRAETPQNEEVPGQVDDEFAPKILSVEDVKAQAANIRLHIQTKRGRNAS